MSRISTQSLFHSSVVQTPWQSYAASGTVHALMAILALAITIPVAREIQKPGEKITLIAPPLPEYRSKPPQRIQPPRLDAHKMPVPLPRPLPQRAFKPPAPVPSLKPVPQPRILAAAPKIEPLPSAIREDSKPDLPPAPKALIKTGAFQPVDLARAQALPQKTAVGGFGDPNGVKPSSDSRPGPLMLTKVGSFDAPTGAGHGGSGGSTQSGGVRPVSFGSVADKGGVSGGTGHANAAVQTGGFGEAGGVPGGSGHGAAPGAIRSSGFGDTASLPPPSPRQLAPAAPAATPVQILYKPRPAYTPEAKNLRLEGEVSLQVIFTSSGSVRVLRIVRGLGHGLDEAAEQAATQVRFKPATRGGVPVDTSATINITFELT